jgi:alkylhydroperoxidase domain protein
LEELMSDQVLSPAITRQANFFTKAMILWKPWLKPLGEEELTPRHMAAFGPAARAKSEYFRLLALSPDILETRSNSDMDIFHNTKDGLPRAERELSAAAVSRVNGCIYCASVHSRFASSFSKREDDVQRLLDEGVQADLGERWNAITEASAALTATPMAFGAEQIGRLRMAGLSDLEIIDVINSAAFFNWANRLMLSLGESDSGEAAANIAPSVDKV